MYLYVCKTPLFNTNKVQFFPEKLYTDDYLNNMNFNSNCNSKIRYYSTYEYVSRISEKKYKFTNFWA